MAQWEDTWKIIKSDFGGGQGDCFIVSKIGDDTKTFFLKQLKDQENSERRRRFFIETTIYRSVDIGGVPQIIYTNADSFKNKSVYLYYVSEHINGLTLDQQIKKQTPSEAELTELLRQLLEILRHCHAKDIVHRDIKPENMIINEQKLYLVDFGISHLKIDEKDNATKLGQEIGNRFLRLPEFSAGSFNKRDPRSDLTLAAGIALYGITGQYPRSLVDETGKMPHQTPSAVTKIQRLSHATLWNLIFDKAFQHKIDSRWNYAEDLLSILDIMENKEASEDNSAEILSKYAAQIDHDQLTKLKNELRSTQAFLVRNVEQILAAEATVFRQEKMGWVYQLGKEETKDQIRAYKIGSTNNDHLAIDVKTILIGEQIVGIVEINNTDHEIIRSSFGGVFNQQDADAGPSKLKKIIFPKLVELLPKA